MRIYQLFRLARCRYLLLLLVMQCFTAFAFAQVKLSGKVTDETGATLPGITVTIKGTKLGATTSIDGIYTINADLKPGTYTLVFTGIGFTPKEDVVTVGNAASYTLNQQLTTSVSKLDEVVVTGASLGTTRKQLGTYISTVKSDELSKGATGNVLTALQGKTAGAQITQNSGDPAGGMSVKLRGISTISGSTEPLYIIDGVIIDNSTTRVTNADASYAGGNFAGNVGQNRMVDINPADIESIEVLNGAAAAAIYGSRANAGVVQIFTKKGKGGAPVVSFSTSFNVNELRKKLDVNQAPVKFGGTPDVSTQTILTDTIVRTTPVKRYDYQDYIFRTGIGTDNNVSVTGGQNKTRYYASASYLYNQGIVRNTDFNRYSFRLNLDQELNKWISFNATMNYIYSKTNEKPDGNSFFSPTNSVTIIGNYYDIHQRNSLGNLLAVGERGRVNPVSVIEDFQQQQQTNRLIAGAGVKLTPFKNLTIDYHMGIDNYSQDGTTFIPPFAYNVSLGFFGGGASLDPTQNGYASAGINNSFLINHDVNVTYDAQITSNLASVTQIGYSLQYQRGHYSLQQGRGLPPFVQTVSGAATPITGADERTRLSISGQYIQQNFKYRDQLFITGALRMDGSSVFGDDERNQLYTKLSGSYVLSGTDYWKDLNVSWWNLFKLRAAYGQSGNLTGIPAYGRFNTYRAVAFIGAASFTSPTTYTNPDIKPERQQELEFGTDLAFWDNRINLSVNYYSKKVEDLLIARAIAPTQGYSTRLDNIGSLQNKGFEVVLNVAPVKSKSFNWDMTAIFNRNRNKALDIGQSILLYSTVSGAPVAIANGEPIGFFYGTFFARDASGNKLTKPNGVPVTEAGVQNSPFSYTPARDPNTGLPPTTGVTALQKKIGDPNPDWTGTLTNDFSYKRLSLHTQLDIVQGVDVFNADFRTRQGVDNGKIAEQEDLGQLPRGFIAGNYNIQEWRIDDGSFVKLREVSLSYNFGKIKGLSDLTLSVGGRNLYSWDNYKGYDPEVNAAGQSTVLRGIDFGSVPAPRTYNVALRARF
ncbi:SusC/RagA family TonB-linked outer membrane protein [Chitinophaga filiformis]|uniref:TonB-linked outer membrane protein, SusC/RagA family n=1 Tax=Chitinophaga filiformis TaxID=104663 RepID=A0A1G7VD84_CHIFI|nr:SusC/RagA family TonB-linked outer membrane protein [Chitinophaga filiformis]SDG57677.1 TonB-linked outer membrane protein, SusC/RagA family [Chitinophaga filiformis]